MTLSKKPERGCDSMEVRLYNRGWSAAIDAITSLPAQQQETIDGATLAGLYASISILSHLVDHQRQLLVEVEDVFGRDGHYGKFEDGECPLIDRVRAQIESIVPQPAQQQEPVATVAEVHMSRYTIEWTNGPLPEGTELYTSPPAQRTWVGLTPEEAQAAVYDKNGCVVDYEDYASAIEAKLKEKNT